MSDANFSAGSRDQLLFEQWRKEPTPQNLSLLLNSLGPLITREVHRASGTLPDSALTAEAKKWAIKAVRTYDPSKGVKLSTHVTNYLQKIRRLNYQYQNVARLPESKQLQFRQYGDAISFLENELSRQPTDEELAAHLGWSKRNVVKYGKLLYKDFTETEGEGKEDTSHYRVARRTLFMKELNKQLTEEEHRLAMLMQRGISSNSRLQAEMGGIPLSTLSYIKANLKRKIEANKGLLE